MPKTKSAIPAEVEAQFIRALVEAAAEFAPSVEALQTSVARHMLNAQGTPDILALFTPPTRHPVARHAQGASDAATRWRVAAFSPYCRSACRRTPVPLA